MSTTDAYREYMQAVDAAFAEAREKLEAAKVRLLAATGPQPMPQFHPQP
ncbi:MAG: hypothetical protein M3O28_11685 [Actinomycetota bacterium]|nr:hypothetical protein [Actinomycetota bacterium]